MSLSCEKQAVVSANLRVHRDRSIAAIWKAIIATIFAGLACYSLFRLPFQFPPKQRLWSASYAFGFNNAVAIAALGLLLCFATLVYIAWKRGSLRPAIEFPVKPGSSGRRSCTYHICSRGITLHRAHISNVFIQRKFSALADVGNATLPLSHVAHGCL